MTSAGERLTEIFLKIYSDPYFRWEEKLQICTEKKFFGTLSEYVEIPAPQYQHVPKLMLISLSFMPSVALTVCQSHFDILLCLSHCLAFLLFVCLFLWSDWLWCLTICLVVCESVCLYLSHCLLVSLCHSLLVSFCFYLSLGSFSFTDSPVPLIFTSWCPHGSIIWYYIVHETYVLFWEILIYGNCVAVTRWDCHLEVCIGKEGKTICWFKERAWYHYMVSTSWRNWVTNQLHTEFRSVSVNMKTLLCIK